MTSHRQARRGLLRLRRRPAPLHARRRSAPSPGAVVGLALFVGTMSVVTASSYSLPSVAVSVAAADPVNGTTTTLRADGSGDGRALSIPGPAGAPAGPATRPTTTAPILRAAAPSTPGTTLGSGAGTTTQPSPRVLPASVSVPSLGISSPLIRLGLHDDGTLEVPDDYRVAGWWSGGAAPGEAGPAVVAGHIDSRVGPGVFAKLAGVRIGETVEIVRTDGVRLRFRITKVARYAKASFPSDEVYGATDGPELRMITCGGNFDEKTRSYEDNVVVYATLT